MIGPHIGGFMMDSTDPLLIPADRVATVRTENNLLHAMTLLSTLNYSAVPVLDRHGRLVGQINLANIIAGIKGMPTYEWDRLQTMTVDDVMDRSPALVSDKAQLEDILHELVKSNYVAVVGRDRAFVGIVTRKAILRRVNHLAHDFEATFDVVPKHKEGTKSGTGRRLIRHEPSSFVGRRETL